MAIDQGVKILSRYSRRFSCGIFLSRISGLGRDLAMAFAFGDHPSVAAFMVAFRFSNLLRRLVAEGPFESAFIPHFEELRLQDPQRANFFFRKLIWIFCLFLSLLTGIVIIGINFFIDRFPVSDSNREIFLLARWLFPVIIFICLYGLNISFLRCHDCFFIPAVAPFVCNVVWILTAVFQRNQNVSLAMITLAKFVVIGILAQWLVTLPLVLRRVRFSLKEWFDLRIPLEVKRLFRSLALGAIGVGAVQINAFADCLFARVANLRGPVYLWYSLRIEQLIFAVLGIAFIQTVIPRLSRAIKGKNQEEINHLFSFSYQRMAIVMILCSFAVIALGKTSIHLIYGYSRFSEIGLMQTSFCLWAYGMTLFPSTMTILFSSLFFSNHDFRTPTETSILCVGINIFLNTLAIFVFRWGIVSIAIATTISAWINFLVLQKRSRRFVYETNYSILRIFRVGLGGLFALLCTMIMSTYLFRTHISIFSGSVVHQIVALVSQFFIFITSLLLYALIFRNRDLLEVFKQYFLLPSLFSKKVNRLEKDI